MNLGFLYAGQGSQHPGMGADLYEAYPAFRAVFDAAQEEVDFDLKRTCFEDPEGVLNQTRYTQPCMVAFAAGLTAVLREKGILPSAAAGLSLGEYSALHAAGVFDARTAVRLVAFRGRAMEEAAQGHESAMVAVLGLDREPLQAACETAADLGTVVIANYNCPMQLVIGGALPAVEEASRLALEAGAKRCVPLKVSGPFHTALMDSAAEKLHEEFQDAEFGDMNFPVIFNATARPLGNDETLPELLEKQVHQSVLFEDTVRYMAEQGIDTVVEIGPGKALSGFIRKTVKGIKTYAIEDAESFRQTVAALHNQGALQ